MEMGMPKIIENNFTNILLGLILSLGSFWGNSVINKLDQQSKDIVDIKVSLGMIKVEQDNLKIYNDKQDVNIKTLQDKKIGLLYKNEDIYELKTNKNVE